MTNENESIRGANFVKKWGRTRPAIAGMKDFWSEVASIDKGMSQILMGFWQGQLGLSKSLKFWHCEEKQFPKLNERMRHEKKAAQEYYSSDESNWDSYPYEGSSRGNADPYFKPDPLQRETEGIPFRIIHTRPITNDRAKMAALSFIRQDDVLQDVFEWDNRGPKKWDGAELLGIEPTKRLSLPKDIVADALATWFIWVDGNPTDPKKLDVAKHTITIISESAVRTLNWYNTLNKHRLFSVDRMEEISEKFRGDKWSKPTALKSFRLDWPVMRNIEEAAAITGTSVTKTVENLVTNNLGEITRKQCLNDYKAELKKCEDDPSYRYEGIDGEMIQEKWEEMWHSYARSIKPLGQNCKWELEYKDDPVNFNDDSLTEARAIAKTLQDKQLEEFKAISKKLDRFDAFMAEAPKGGHSVSSDGKGTVTVERISPAPKTALREMQMITMAMTDPVDFNNATPGIYTQLRGKLKDGVAVEDDFHTETFVGYKKKLKASDTSLTYSALADLANIGFSAHFEGQSPIGGGDKWVTGDMLEWASGGKPITKNMEIICPDPRTMNKRIRKSLETK